MSDRPVRTRVMADGSWVSLQEFLIRRRGEGPIAGRRLPPRPRGGAHARGARGHRDGAGDRHRALQPGDLHRPDPGPPRAHRRAQASPAAVVAVSPLVNGQVLKGPTEACLRWARRSVSSAGIAETYDGIIDGLVADERTRALPVLETSVLMDDGAARRRVAEQALQFALGLRK